MDKCEVSIVDLSVFDGQKKMKYIVSGNYTEFYSGRSTAEKGVIVMKNKISKNSL